MAKNCHSYNTRKAAKIHPHLPSVKAKFCMRTFGYFKAPKLWNNLPFDILITESLLKFKSSVKEIFHQ